MKDSPSSKKPKDDLTDVDTKSILKKCPSSEHRVPAVHWNEEIIAEHDKDRGTRCKIDEPNTPYHHYDSNEELPDLDDISMMNDARSIGTLPQALLQDLINDISKTKIKVLTQESAETGKVNISDLVDRLEKLSELRNSVKSDSLKSDLADDLLSPRQEELKRQFKEKRRSHYDEFLKVKQLSQTPQSEDEEEGE